MVSGHVRRHYGVEGGGENLGAPGDANRFLSELRAMIGAGRFSPSEKRVEILSASRIMEMCRAGSKNYGRLRDYGRRL